jgi:dipeptidyl aminopeptidase/acylaminoacyl peptidase
VLNTDLWRVNIDGSNDHRILAIDGWTLGSPRPSGDGAVIAFLGSRIDEPAFRQNQLGIASIKGETASDPVWLTDESTFPSSVDGFQWVAMQPALLFTCAMRGGFPLMTVSPSLLQPATIVGEDDGRPAGVGAFASGGGAMVFSVCSAANPCVLKMRDGKGIRTLYDLNEWVKNKAISLPTASEITRPDGTKVQCWLMEPTNREVGRKYPLCLEMHGGPAAMWGPGEFTMWHEFQLLCSWGYGVVYCNPRGSGGYGYKFQKANFQDWGDGPAGDVLAAVDQAALKDWVDPEKLVITGGSYAGYLTAWVIAHDHRFKAAVAQRGVYDLNTFFGEGNAWRLVPWAFGGEPYEAKAKDVIARNSPFTHVAKIKTPLLIMHSSNDLRTGVSQSEMLYRALKELGRDVEYVRYPNSGHDLSRTGDPRQRMDRLDRIIEFFERYIDNPRSPPR